jgi:cation diffusion facilitator CzcD-associated flavoprotein CzcO
MTFDRPALFYSFSFAPNYLSRTIFPSGRDYVDYLYNVVERVGIADKIQLNMEVTSAEWIEEDSEWELQLYRVHGQEPWSGNSKVERPVETIRAKVVINAVGILVEPTEWPPGVAGRDAYHGELIHSARWPEKVNLDGKDVVLVGSGCSAAQIAPALLQTNVKSLSQVMRTPPWLVPRVEEPGGREAYAKWAPRIYNAIPGLGFTVRMLLCAVSELLWYTAFQRPNGSLRQREEASSLAHMRALTPTAYHNQLTPKYRMGCKRRIYDNDWLHGMHDPRFLLESRHWRSAADTSITVGDKDNTKTYRADVLILATGFEATKFLHPISVLGRHGLSLHGLWNTRGSPHAYLGTAVDGFPNFFLILGPNTFAGHTSVMMAIENSVDHTMRMITPILNGEVASIEPKTVTVQIWLAGIRRDMATTVFASCQSWYNGGGGPNSVMYPYVSLITSKH